MRRRIALLGPTIVTAFLFLPLSASEADPEPTTTELQDRAQNLHDQVAVLAERYNGLRLQLRDARRAAKLSARQARAQAARLDRERSEIRRLAAARYMTGTLDPAIEFVASDDPRVVLDRATTLHRLAQRDVDRLRTLSSALLGAQRTRQVAQQRADEVAKLTTRLAAKKRRIEALLQQTQTELLARATRLSSGGHPVGKIPGSSKAVQAANYALSQRGKPYRWGAAGPDAYDCSGLTMWAYRQVGIKIPHYTGAQYKAGTPVARSDLRVGDLVFFYPDRHHTGIYIGNGKMVHSPYSGTVVQVDTIGGRPWAGAVRIV